MAKKGSQGNSRGILKFLFSIIIVIVLIASIFEAIVGGVIETFVGVITSIGETLDGTIKKIGGWFGKSMVENGMQMNIISNDDVKILKQELEAQSIVTEKIGLNEVRIRKMILANCVTTSFSDTLCAAELVPTDVNSADCTESQSILLIINALKERYPEESITEDNFTDYLNKQDGSNYFKGDQAPNYDVYIEKLPKGSVFFYFKDEDKKLSENGELWYIGAMGATTLSSAEGGEMEYYNPAGFDALIEEYNGLSKGEKRRGDTEVENKLKKAYTKKNGDSITVANINKIYHNYLFEFENQNITKDRGLHGVEEDGKIHLETGDVSDTYEVTPQELFFNIDVDMSSYAIPIELMIDMLNITGSGDYIEEFIDYSLARVEAKINLYSLDYKSTDYVKNEFEIKNDFIAELYDMEFGSDGDIDSDNFVAYKNIIIDRTFNGTPFVKSITHSENSEIYNYKNSEYSVSPLSTYLICGYENEENEVGPIKVTEMTETINETHNVQAKIGYVRTWYGVFQYTTPEIVTEYSAGEASIPIEKEEYDNYTEGSLVLEEEINEDKTYSAIGLTKHLDDDYFSSMGEHIQNSDYPNYVSVRDSGSDLFDDWFNEEPGEGNQSKFSFWRIRGLVYIGACDNGNKNECDKAASGCDIIYAKYTRNNLKKYTGSKVSMQYLKENGITITTSEDSIEQNAQEFLRILKNDLGEKYSENNGVKWIGKDGKVVMFDDIYNGIIPAGDLLFINGADSLFQLLKSAPNSQNLVNVFKYLAYLYSGIDYGITEASQIEYIFAVSNISGIGSDITVYTASGGEELVLTEEQLRQAIEATYSGSSKTNLLSAIDGFMYIQNTYKVNAVFGVAVTIIESGAGTGTGWDLIEPSTYNWISIKGSYNGQSYKDRNGTNWRKYTSFSEATKDFGNLIANSAYYFKAGRYTVKTIAPTYCNENWGSSVVAEMSKIYSKIGISISTGGTEITSGQRQAILNGRINSYTQTSIEVNGRTHINYIQNDTAWGREIIVSRNMADAGCALTSIADIASGYVPGTTPNDVRLYEKNTPANHTAALNHYTGYSYIKSGYNINNIKNSLRAGKPVMLRWSHCANVAGSGGHFVALLAISDDGSQIYYSDPADTWYGNTGWQSINFIESRKGYVSEIYYVK